MKIISEINGFILAGGKSSRMGTDKALLMIQDEPLLKRMITIVSPFCKSLGVSGSNAEYSKFNVQLIPDLYIGCGPISGIYSSLNYSNADWNLLVSVDVPFINDELLRLLFSNIGEYDCIIPEHNSGVEPLIGLYNKQTLPVIEKMIKNGEYKLRSLLSKLNTRFVDCNSLVEKFPGLFMNINRMEDFLAI